MKIDEFNTNIDTSIDNAGTLDDVKTILRALVDENTILRKQLNVILGNLNSDNIAEVDFGRTRHRNAKDTLLKGYATQTWVTANFQPKG